MFNRQFIKIPTNRNYGEAATGKHENIFGGFNWSHQFTDDWSVKHSVSVNQQTTNRLSVVPLPLWLSPLYGFPADQVPRALYQYNNKYNTYATNIDLIGHFYTGILKHTLLLGGDYYRKDLYLDNGLNVAASYVDINYPIHTGTNGGMTLDPASAYTSSQYSDQYGIYLQDQIKLPYHFNVTGGLRYQYIHQSSAQVDSTGTVNQFPSLTADAVTPRVGLLWQPQNWLSLYSNYTENFGANQGTVFPNQAAAPSSAQQWEVGAKTEFFDGRLRATLAYFDLTKTNVPSVDPNPAHSGFSLLTGEVRSRGPELDIQGEILPGWNVIATYANTDIIVTKAGDGDYPAVGSRYYGVPRNTASLWNTYDFQQEHLKGFKVGGGVTLRDGQVANTTSAANAPAFTIPGYGTVDLLAAYSQNVGKTRVTAQLNINNLLDKYYYTSATFLSSPSTTGYDGGFVNFGAPRTVMGSIRIEY
jgi:iron complex outermembrane receptor protein